MTEEKGHWPALVVSKDLFKSSTSWAIECPMTTTDRGFPFRAPIPEGSKLTGFVMVEQVQSVDYQARRARRIERRNEELLSEVLSIVDA
ncbi:type II toxin-antitoxin system PemK/MazF family toxin [Desulfobulbus alkaliphilus]|uniref:type II toxin-antitoxin system PemK/MazF family toxin n=1 Tax=Desulfobulbus alkaliphilus TaxID=869814 RepID=UPI0019668496|nr:type II toxin-antitoxin system PemK/MazF family toxin [Desulfobulbus alkaliphilus]